MNWRRLFLFSFVGNVYFVREKVSAASGGVPGVPPPAYNKDIPQKAIPFVLFVIILSEGFNIVFLFGEFVMHTGT